MPDVRLLAVDLDGTLVDSAPDLTRCIGTALAALGLPAPRERDTITWIGDGIEMLLRRALTAASGAEPDAAMLAETLQRFDVCYAENLFVLSRLYPGVTATLDELGSRGVVLACVTNKRHVYAERLLELAGLRDRFAFVFGGDSFAEKKPSPAPLEAAAKLAQVRPDQAALLGDSVNDRRAASNAGFRFFWAAYGYDDLEDIDAAERIDAFPDILSKLAP